MHEISGKWFCPRSVFISLYSTNSFQLQASLANILHSITAEDFNREEDVISKSSGHMLPAAPPHPHNDEDQFISMTEDFSQEEEDGSVGDKNSSLQVTSPGANKMSDDEGDLSKTLSVERSIAKDGIDIEPAEVVDGGGGSRGNLKMAAKDEEDGGDSSLGLGSVSLDLSRGGEGGKVGEDEEIKEELPLDDVEGMYHFVSLFPSTEWKWDIISQAIQIVSIRLSICTNQWCANLLVFFFKLSNFQVMLFYVLFDRILRQNFNKEQV